MRGEIKRLHQGIGKTMVYVTHDQIEAMTLADRIVLLKDGRIEQQGAPLDLFERPATRFVAGFLGSPSMNFVPATVEGGGVRFADGTMLPLPAARVARLNGSMGRGVTFGVRPEHVSRAAAGERRPGVERLSAVIDLLQPTGSRTYATFRLSGTPVIAELQAHDVSRPGERLELWIDMNRIVLIDPESERVLQ
jgi:multiple sugar transport system ATP-binding protein